MKNLTYMAEASDAAFNIEEAGYSFNHIEFNINDRSLMNYPVSAYAYHYEDKFEGKLSISGIKTRERVDDNVIKVSIHRYGSLKNIVEKEYTPDYEDDDWLLLLHYEIDDLTPGLYTLCIENATPLMPDLRLHGDGTGCHFSFRILPYGADLKHPTLKNTEARLCKGEEDGKSDGENTRKGLIVATTMSMPMTDNDLYDVCCFDSSLMLMGNAAKTEVFNKGVARAIVQSAYAWTEGEYYCFVRHNGVPFAKITLSISAEGKAVVGSIETMEASSPLYLMARRADSIAKMQDLFNAAGCRNIKERGLLFHRAYIHNLLYRRGIVSDITPCKHHIFYGKGGKQEEQLIEDYVCCAFPNYTQAEIDIAEINCSCTTINPVDSIKERIDGDRKVVFIKNANSMIWLNGKIIVRALEERLRNLDDLILIFHGTESEMRRLEETYPSLLNIVSKENRLSFPALSITDAVHGIQKALESKDLKLSATAEKKLVIGLTRRIAKGNLAIDGIDFCTGFIEQAIMPRFCNRMFADGEGKECERMAFLTTIEPDDIDWSSTDNMVAPLAESLGEINGMVGLKSVKDTITTLSMKAAFDAKRRKEGKGNCDKGAYHMIFTGNPGTGKTTVAKKLGKILHSLGILSKGDVVMAERSTIVGRFIGQTEENMQQLLQQARGNVLFIDEAYTLCDTTDDRKDYGYRAIECLLTVLAEQSPDMVVILAGYENEMERMLMANQGLKGRFPYHLKFNDYDADELMEIGMRYLNAYDLDITPDAKAKLRNIIEQQTARHEREFSNARWMEQLIDNSIIPTLSERIFMQGDTTNESSITIADIEKVAAKLPQGKAQKKIGF